MLWIISQLMTKQGISKPCQQNDAMELLVHEHCQKQTQTGSILSTNHLRFADMLQIVETTCIKPVDKSLYNQLASSLLTTSSRLVIIKQGKDDANAS